MAEKKQTELCTIDGKTYIAVETASGVSLAEQTAKGPVEISGVTHAAGELRKLKALIRVNTPAVQEINAHVLDKIREHYSVADEIKMLRIAPSVETAAWNDHVENCRSWGRGEKEKLGL